MTTVVKAEPSADAKTLTIKIDGRFDFGAHQAFRDAYERVHPEPEKFVVDLQATNYLDSSALGMLLLLRDHAGGDRSDVTIINSTKDVRQILGISNFDKLFEIK